MTVPLGEPKTFVIPETPTTVRVLDARRWLVYVRVILPLRPSSFQLGDTVEKELYEPWTLVTADTEREARRRAIDATRSTMAYTHKGQDTDLLTYRVTSIQELT